MAIIKFIVFNELGFAKDLDVLELERHTPFLSSTVDRIGKYKRGLESLLSNADACYTARKDTEFYRTSFNYQRSTFIGKPCVCMSVQVKRINCLDVSTQRGHKLSTCLNSSQS